MAEFVPQLGAGTILEVREGPIGSEPWYRLGGITGLTPPSSTKGEVDVTDMDSTALEYIPTLPDRGEMACTVNYKAGSTTDLFLLEWDASGELRDTRITYVSGRTQTITTFVKSYVPNELTPNAPSTAALSLRCSGDSTWA